MATQPVKVDRIDRRADPQPAQKEFACGTRLMTSKPADLMSIEGRFTVPEPLDLPATPGDRRLARPWNKIRR